jgi:hypothetical protein
MVDEDAFWAAIGALDDGLAPPPGCKGQRDLLLERLCTDGPPVPAARPARKEKGPPVELGAAMVAFIGACIFAGAVSAAFVFHSPLERLIVR